MTFLKKIFSARVPNKKEVQPLLLLTQCQRKSQDLDWPSQLLQITETTRKREEILKATLPYKREIRNPVLQTQRIPKSENPGLPSKRLLITEPLWKRDYPPNTEEILLANLPEEIQQDQRFIGNYSLSTWKRILN